MIFKRALVFRCRCEYSLLIKGALTMITTPVAQNDHTASTRAQNGLPEEKNFPVLSITILIWELYLAILVMLIVDMTLLFISTINHHRCNSETVNIVNIVTTRGQEGKKGKKRVRGYVLYLL